MSSSDISAPATPSAAEKDVRFLFQDPSQKQDPPPPPNPKPKKKTKATDSTSSSTTTGATGSKPKKKVTKPSSTAQPTQQSSTASAPPPPPPPHFSAPAPTTKAKKMGTVGILKPFDPATDEFEDWATTFNCFLIANELDVTKHDKRCHAIFISHIGIQSCALLKNLISPDSLEKTPLADLMSKMQDHYKPTPKALAERYKFMRRHRNAGETVTQYLAALRTLARHCKFTSDLDTRVRDQFILGVENDKLQRAILSKDDDIKLEEVLKTAVAMETAESSTSIIRGGSTQLKEQDPSTVHKTEKFRSRKWNKGSSNSPNNNSNNKDSSGHQQKSQQQSRSGPSKDNNQSYKCRRCGSAKHKYNECKHTDAECFKCHKKGHFASVCLSSQKKDAHRVTTLKVIQRTNKLNDNHHHPIIYITVEIAGVPHKMELDTGCESSLLSKKFWQQVGKPPLLDCPFIFGPYKGPTFKALGDFQTTITYNGTTIQHRIPVVDGDSLLGRDLLHLLNFDWSTLNTRSVNNVTTTTVNSLLEEYKDVFSTPTSNDRIKGFKASIILKDDAHPRFLKARPLPYAIYEKVDLELQNMEKQGVITKVDTSEWASPLVVVQKPNGKVRITGDFKDTVNSQLHVTQYPIAVPEDVFAISHNCTVFSKLDGSNAYHQLELDENSKDFLVINTHRGLFRYNVLPQGVSSAPAIFQRTMDEILKNVQPAKPYMDDTLAADKTLQQHLTTLRKIFEQLRHHNVKLNKDKCELAKSTLDFLGHTISAAGISTTSDKVQAITSIQAPRDVHQLSSFMGLVNFYFKFLPKLADVAEPLYALKRQDVQWKWTQKCQAAFDEVKRLITTAPTLAHFDPALPIGISCDSSSVGAGVVLFHKYPDGSERPIAFASRTLSETEKRYSQIEKEGLSIIFGIKKYYKFLCGRRFLLVTDHRPLLKIFGPKTGLPVYVASRLHHWAVYLQQFQYEVVYRKSADHGNADALSRCLTAPATTLDPAMEKQVKVVASVLCSSLPITSAKIKYFTARDTTLSKVLQFQRQGWPAKLSDEDKCLQQFFVRREEMTVVNNVLLWGMRVIIPPSLRTEILKELHSMYTGIVKMKSLARLHVLWPGLDGDIEGLCKSCAQCQQKAADPPASPLHPWQHPEQAWDRLHLDLAGPFQNKNWIILVDAHSKWPEVIPVQSTTSQVVIQKLEEVFARFGLPAQVVTDNGRQFTSDEFEQFLKSNNVKHILSSVYHPRTNGEAERFVRTFKEAMKCTDLPVNKRLTEFLQKYRSTPHSTTGVPPSELLLGRVIKTGLDLVHPSLKTTVSNSQLRQEVSHNKRAKIRELLPGQAVWVKSFSKNEEKWSYGRILRSLGPVSFLVDVGGRQLKRHVDQMRFAQQQQHNNNEDNIPGMDPEAVAATDARRSLDHDENYDD